MDKTEELLDGFKAFLKKFNYVPKNRVSNSSNNQIGSNRPRVNVDISFKEFERQERDIAWNEELFYLIDSRGLSDPDVYKKANMSRQAFSKIRCNKDYHPDKDTVISLCFALELPLEDSISFLNKAGYTLSQSSLRDLAVRYMLYTENYNLFELDAFLNKLECRAII